MASCPPSRTPSRPPSLNSVREWRKIESSKHIMFFQGSRKPADWRFFMKETCISFWISIFALTAVLPLFAAENKSIPSETAIWFDKPASDFTESSPLGNGRLGAMMFGGVDEERIVLNESSVWSGSRQDADRPDAYKVLPEIQKLLLEGKNPEAEALVNANFTCTGSGSGGKQYGCYQVLANLHLSFPSGGIKGAVTNYRRELNLNDAITRLKY